MKNCIFCKIYQDQQGIIYEDKFFYAQFDAYPASPGHAEIIPLRHIVSILELKKREWNQLKRVIPQIIEIIKKQDLKVLYQKMSENSLSEKSKFFCEKMLRHFKIEQIPDGYNIGVNEGRAAGQSIDHLHFHIIPRYLGDIKVPIGGIRRVIPGHANYRE
jgi:diadenosine tetraphosphate (Ap4A) HIT family hydrolase